MKNMINAVGLMSGTSADGLSLAYCAVNLMKRKISLLAFDNYPYSRSLRENIMNARSLNAERIFLLNYKLGRLWSDMLLSFLKKHGVRRQKIDVIGSHGQTIYHNSRLKNTFQIGEASFLAEAIGRPVVCDFRHQDLAAGGEGAPLVPYFDEFLFGQSQPTALENIGGIGNISLVGRGIKTCGFDTGPGNSLMDWAIQRFTGGKLAYDKNGAWAAKGKVDFKKVEKFMKAPFFSIRPPKSLDREEFGAGFLSRNFNFKKESRFDVLATLNYFTAFSVFHAVRNHLPVRPRRLVISGGGAYNGTLISNIRKLLPDVRVQSLMELGIDPLAKEAMAFALLAALRLVGIPNNCPSATGAVGHRVLGKLISPFPGRN